MIDRWLYGRFGFLLILLVCAIIAGTGIWIMLALAAWDRYS